MNKKYRPLAIFSSFLIMLSAGLPAGYWQAGHGLSASADETDMAYDAADSIDSVPVPNDGTAQDADGDMSVSGNDMAGSTAASVSGNDMAAGGVPVPDGGTAPDDADGMTVSGNDMSPSIMADDVLLYDADGPAMGIKVEYYAYMEIPKDGSVLPIITVRAGSLVNNLTSSNMRLRYLNVIPKGKLDAGKVATDSVLTEIFMSRTFSREDCYGTKGINIFGRPGIDGTHAYELSEIWVLKKDADGDFLPENERGSWDVYDNGSGMGPVTGLRFVYDADDAEGDGCLLLSDPAVVRLVCTQVEGAYVNGLVNFHDYDINSSNRKGATTGSMTTGASGINSASNYAYDGGECAAPRLAFGNANTGLQWALDLTNGETVPLSANPAVSTFGGNLLNMYSSRSRCAKYDTYNGCTFGLAEKEVTNGRIKFTVNAPNLFLQQDEPVIGRHDYNGELTFIRLGDTYTLSAAAVGGYPAIRDLEKLVNPKQPGQAAFTDIWTNNFWPMDGVNNYDMHFGSTANHSVQKFNSSYNYRLGGGATMGAASDSKGKYGWYKSTDSLLPVSDDGLDHNNYFGMDFSVDFVLSDDYTGPLTYIFYGDDDLWIYLTETTDGANPDRSSTLVCDIGGVHSSVGEQVDLWKYISKPDSIVYDEDGMAGTRTYRLNFYYTERGASGSTCWMQFNLPSASISTEPLAGTGTADLTVRKKVRGELADPGQEFMFTLYLKDGDGAALEGQYTCTRYDAEGKMPYNPSVAGNGSTFVLKADECIRIAMLPEDAMYSVIELDADIYRPEYSMAGMAMDDGMEWFRAGDGELAITNRLPGTNGSLLVEKQELGPDDSVVTYVPGPRSIFRDDGSQAYDGHGWPDMAGYGTEGGIDDRWLLEHLNDGYFIFRLMLYGPVGDDGSYTEDGGQYGYSIYRAYTDDGNAARTDHLRAGNEEGGPYLVEQGTYGQAGGGLYFALRGGEYLIMEGLPSGTCYSIEELAAEKYAVSYSLGSHGHTYDDGGQSVRQDDIRGPEDIQGVSAGLDVPVGIDDANYILFINAPDAAPRLTPPATGGPGMLPAMACGTALLLCSLALIWYSRRKHGWLTCMLK